MEGKGFLGHYLIWVILLLGQLQGCKSCVENERKALLELKKYLISKSSESSYREETGESNPDFVLPTWTNDTKSDCCRWKGVECNRTSGRVIGISVGRVFFKHSLLNLSLLHPFEEIRSLNLSPGRDIDAFSFKGFFDEVEGYKSLRKLKYLEILDLSSNAFTNDIFPFLDGVTSLTTLNLRCNFMATSRKELDNRNLGLRHLSNSSIRVLTRLKNLKALDLTENLFSSSKILQDLKNLTNLEVLGLAGNKGDGPIPIEVCEMKNLHELDLSSNYFLGEIPLCLGSLNMLRVLDLSSNQLSGNLPSSFSSLESLEYLSLVDNNFTSIFSLNPLTNLTKLKVLKLSSTSDMVQVETESDWQPKFQLSVAVLRSCSLEKIPSFLLYQKNLQLVDLSSNRLSGHIPTWLLANNSKLEVLQLQNNAYTIFEMPSIVHHLKVLDVSANHIGGIFPENIGHGLPNMVDMNGSYNEFQGEFPSSMGEMKNISLLDLSYNNFSGTLPKSFLTRCFSLKYLMLSHNKFIGHFLPRGTSFTSLRMLRMDNNSFTGKIRVGLLSSPRLMVLDMSNNFLTGFIPSWISKLSRLDSLLLSNNFLGSTIPPSLVDLNPLSTLDLSGNVLSGALPSHMAVSNLFLHNNNFTGPIPSLWESVNILSLGNNKLSGSIPQFVNSPDIHILLLRGNNLTRDIPRQLCDLSNIAVLDLSQNKLSGLIPSCLSNLSFGKSEGESTTIINGVHFPIKRFKLEFYKYTFVVEELMLETYTSKEIEINIAVKQRYEPFPSGGYFFRVGILDYMYVVDLSNNELSGDIPAEFGDQPILKAMNLSHNLLSGSIPSSFSNLEAIESLDLSYNMLHGSIPYQLTNLTSLEVFDVSHNNLSGIIPRGKQFNTFDEKNYFGNPLLCGLPTHIRCEAKKSSEEANNGRGEEENEEAVIDRLVFYYSTASVYATALISIVVLMCFDCPLRRAWLRIVDAFIASAKNKLS